MAGDVKNTRDISKKLLPKLSKISVCVHCRLAK